MGMDIHGKNPKNIGGEYFRNNVWWWRPLANYVCAIAPDITQHCSQWQSNDGDGLNETQCKQLAERIREDIGSGATLAYEQAYKAGLQHMPDESCDICAGTGYRKETPDTGAGDIPCNGCSETGKVSAWETHYPFELSNVEEFADFLTNCGGFEIW